MIELKSIRKSFGEQVVLDGIDLCIEEGETFAVVGKTGVGKTVLLRHIVGLVRPDSGRIFVDGEDITDLGDKEFARIRLKCGMVFQQPTLFDSLTVGENVAFGLRRHRKLSEQETLKAVRENLDLVYLKDIENLMPSEISFGMQKRVGLARTIALRPKYLLYDEPTTGLDPLTADMINRLIIEMAKKLKVTSIVVTHDMDSVYKTSDRVALLHDGKLVEISAPEVFKKSPNPIVQRFLRGESVNGE